jgi:hypothetical protein
LPGILVSIVRAVTLAVACLAAAYPTHGQEAAAPETRAGRIAAEQAAKTRAVAPYTPTRVELFLARAEERGFPLVGTPVGFYPAIGSVYPGGGLGLGAGYRFFTGERTLFALQAQYSLATYKRVEATVQSPGHVRGRLELDGRAGWLDAPRIAFFGLGPDSFKDDRVAFGLRETYVEGGVMWRPAAWLRLRAATGYDGYTHRPGTGRFPSIEEGFSSLTAPHLGEDPTFARFSASTAFSWVESAQYTRAGGRLSLSYNGYHRLDEKGEFGLTRTEIVQHVPVLRDTWVLALRARADSLIGEVADAPFFLFPSLGSGTTLRAFPTHRFRDRHTLLLTGEWRWLPNRRALDVAIFTDAGKVGPTWTDLREERFVTDVGIGVRFHTPTLYLFRVDLSRGSEGWHLGFTTSAPF